MTSDDAGRDPNTRKERRSGVRRPIDLAVYIRYRKRRFLCAQARNITAGGMFLEIQSLTLPIGTPVELEFREFGRGWLIPGTVTQGNSQGIGVMFRDAQPDLFRQLTQRREDTPPPIVAAGNANSILDR
jgi:hypothetical protein